MKLIDSHVHVVQYIAGTGAGGELRSIGGGMARYADGQVVRMIPEQFHSDSFTPEQLLEVMDSNGVERAVLLQGNFYGFQNYYTYQAMKKYPDRFTGAAGYDPYSFHKDQIRRYLFEELGFRIEKFEVSTGSGLMAVHPDFRIDSERMDEAFSYANDQGHVVVIDIGKCKGPSWQIEALRKEVMRYPDMKFVACHLLAPSAKDEACFTEALKRLTLPNLWFDLASVVHNCREAENPYQQALHYVELAAQIVGTDKLLFGTDLPSVLKEDSYENCVGYIRRSGLLTEEDQEKIFYKNSCEVYFK
ncbi:MAG: amidohydrolase family protein [Lachnospiraceae bacterium]|nr:amidohydrolase family protein [Lachnospiraceae bacterium]